MSRKCIEIHCSLQKVNGTKFIHVNFHWNTKSTFEQFPIIFFCISFKLACVFVCVRNRCKRFELGRIWFIFKCALSAETSWNIVSDAFVLTKDQTRESRNVVCIQYIILYTKYWNILKRRSEFEQHTKTQKLSHIAIKSECFVCMPKSMGRLFPSMTKNEWSNVC